MQVNLSQFADDIVIWAQASGIYSQCQPKVAKIPEPNPTLVWQMEDKVKPRKGTSY